MALVTGAIKALDVPDDVGITTVRELVILLEKLLAVTFEEERITNVVVSSNEPDTTSRDVIWFRTDNSGSFVGIFVFVQGQWLQMFPPPQGVFRMYGRSDDIPDGFQLISETTVGFTADMVTAVSATWHEIGSTGVYDIFDVVYVGL